MRSTLYLAVFAIFTSLSYADQGSFTNSGGSTQAGSGITITSSVSAPAGALTLNCPVTAVGSCGGGNFTFISSDGTITISAGFSTGVYTQSCSGGGRGVPVTCSYSFTGYFGGTYTANGATQAITGVTEQTFGTGGAAANGTTAYNSAYSPFYYTDGQQILRSDDLQGTNQVSYGTQGGGSGQFYGAAGIALDSRGRIYVADSYNCRVVRIDDLSGANWTSYGSCGSGQGQFNDPAGVAIDSSGRVYVMDTGNARLVRMDDMNGTNWISYGTAGAGVGQFSSHVSSVGVDATGHIYIPDTGNQRLVRIDDMSGANWTMLTQSPAQNGVSYYSLQNPIAVSFDSAGRIYIADNETFQPAVIRVDDMTGANWTLIYVGTGGLNSISLDSGGTVFLGGGGVRLVDGMAAVLSSSGTIAPLGPSYVFGIAPIPLGTPRPAAVSLTPGSLSFGNQNTGTTSATQPVSIANFGGSPLDFTGISASGGFAATTDCPGSLGAGSTCTASVSFAPSVSGPANGSLTVGDNSGNLGATQTVTLTGVGTSSAATLKPGSLAFSAQLLNTASAAQSIQLSNTGTGAMQVVSVTATPPFSQTNNCTGSIAPGGNCLIQVTFKPTVTGSISGTLTISGNAGTQTAGLTGIGSSTPPTVTVSPGALVFQQQVLNKQSASQKITVTNTGNTSVANRRVTISGDFSRTTTCNRLIPAGKSCTMRVWFTPTVAGTRMGTIVIELSTGAQTVSLTGTGAAASPPGDVATRNATARDFAGMRKEQ